MSIGAQLRAAREAKGLSVGAIAQRIRVQPRVLSAIEIDDLSVVPPRPFDRGFVRAYADEVDLDPELTVRDYFAQFPALSPAAATGPANIPRVRQPVDPEIELPSQWSGLAVAIAILLIVVAAAVVLGRRGGA